MSGCKMVNGVCCQYCIKFEQPLCPVKTASPWSRWGNFCNAYEHNPKEPQARPLPLKWIMNDHTDNDDKEGIQP